MPAVQFMISLNQIFMTGSWPLLIFRSRFTVFTKWIQFRGRGQTFLVSEIGLRAYIHCKLLFYIEICKWIFDFQEKIVSLVFGMLRKSRFNFVDVYREEAFTAVKAIVKQVSMQRSRPSEGLRPLSNR